MRARDDERALHYAALLRAYTAAEPLPWSDLVIARAEALAARTSGAAGTSELEPAIAAARNLRLLDLSAALEAAVRM